MHGYLLVLKFLAAHYAFVILLSLVSYAIGYRITRRLSYDSFLEEVSMCVSLGLGTIAFLMFLLGLVGLLYRPVVLAASAACVALSYAAVPHLVGKIRSRLSELPKRLVPGGVILFFGAPILLLPFYPPATFDATMYFLASSKIYVQSHQIVFTPYLRLPVFTQLNEMLFTLALLLYDDIAAQLVQLLMLALVCLTLIAFCRKYFSLRAGWWSAALFLASPLVLFFGTVAYVDISLVLFGTMATYSFWKWLGARERSWLVMTGAFCGFAASTKYPGLFYPFVLGLVTLYLAIRERRLAAPFQLAVVTLVIAGPWYVRNFYYTRNPVFPFFPQIFGYSWWSPEDVQHFVSVMKGIGFGRGLRAMLLLPWHLAFRQKVFFGSIPVSTLFFFALPLLAVFTVKDARIRKLVVFAFAFTVFWFYSQQELRYLMPALPMMSVATAASLDMLVDAIPSTRKWTSHWIATVVVAGAMTFGGWQFARDMRHWYGPVPVTQLQRDTFLAQRLASYPAYKLLNDRKGRNYKVYALYNIEVAYYVDGTYMGDLFGPARYDRITRNLSDGRALYTELRAMGADFFLVTNQGWEVPLPKDAFFYEHFKLIYSQKPILLFELNEGEVKPDKFEK